jgi:copper chaperone CopZ
MNPSHSILPCLVLTFVFAALGAGQVEKVAMRTTGISCGVCAGLSEIYFHRLPGVDKVKISLSQEAIMLTFKPGAKFDPNAIRKILEPLKVGVVQFQVDVRGQVHETGGKRILEAGGDRFILLDAIDSPEIPAGLPLRIEGILYDRNSPMEIKVLKVEEPRNSAAHH